MDTDKDMDTDMDRQTSNFDIWVSMVENVNEKVNFGTMSQSEEWLCAI